MIHTIRYHAVHIIVVFAAPCPCKYPELNSSQTRLFYCSTAAVTVTHFLTDSIPIFFFFPTTVHTIFTAASCCCVLPSSVLFRRMHVSYDVAHIICDIMMINIRRPG